MNALAFIELFFFPQLLFQEYFISKGILKAQEI